MEGTYFSQDLLSNQLNFVRQSGRKPAIEINWLHCKCGISLTGIVLVTFAEAQITKIKRCRGRNKKTTQLNYYGRNSENGQFIASDLEQDQSTIEQPQAPTHYTLTRPTNDTGNKPVLEPPIPNYNIYDFSLVKEILFHGMFTSFLLKPKFMYYMNIRLQHLKN